MIAGVDHVGLVVRDMNKQLAFYRDILGLRVLHDKEVGSSEGRDQIGIDGLQRRLVFLTDESGGVALELVYNIHPKSPEGNPLDRHQICSMHLCFTVRNLQDKYELLKTKGVQFLTPPVVIDRPVGGPVCLVYFRDAEGNWLEFKEEFEK